MAPLSQSIPYLDFSELPARNVFYFPTFWTFPDKWMLFLSMLLPLTIADRHLTCNEVFITRKLDELYLVSFMLRRRWLCEVIKATKGWLAPYPMRVTLSFFIFWFFLVLFKRKRNEAGYICKGLGPIMFAWRSRLNVVGLLFPDITSFNWKVVFKSSAFRW